MAKRCPPGKIDRALELVEDDPSEGLEALEALSKKYPSDPAVRHTYGVTLLELGETAAALPHLEEALKRENAAETHAALMVAYARLNMEVHARRAAARAHALGLSGVPLPEKDLEGDVPAGAKEKDLLEFERGRFDILQGETKRGLRAMTAFAQRFPDYQPALNLLATGYFTDADLGKYREAATQALERAPENPHALLNYARLKLLEEGREAVEALKPRIVNAPVGHEARVVDGELAQAQALAFMGDDKGVKKALAAWHKTNRHPEFHPLAAWLEERLEAREADKNVPFYRLRELIPGQLKRWQALPSKRLTEAVAQDLRAVPGFLSLIPGHLGFEDEATAKLLAALLLELKLPEPAGPWSEVVREVALSGPGERDTRLELLLLLKQLGFVSEGEPIAFAGMPEGVNVLELELSFEPEPSVLTDAELEQMGGYLEGMRAGRFAEVRPLIEKLVERYPDDTSLLYNLALCELYDSSLPDGKARGHARLEKLVEEHPNYLFARAHLGAEAVITGDLARAHALLRFPEGLKRLHVEEYATFLSAQGRLALAEGEVESAEKMLDTLEELVGEDSSAFVGLERALEADGQRGLLGAFGALLKRGLGSS